jgi:structural maintenance of chromosome 1
MTKVRDCNNELEECKSLVNSLGNQFETVRQQRISLFQVCSFYYLHCLNVCFQDCFNHISATLSEIYRDLTKSSKHPLGFLFFVWLLPFVISLLGGNAYLLLENSDEPYLGGVRYTAMPPMKRFRYLPLFVISSVTYV